jgi:hypothetical protein
VPSRSPGTHRRTRPSDTPAYGPPPAGSNARLSGPAAPASTETSSTRPSPAPLSPPPISSTATSLRASGERTGSRRPRARRARSSSSVARGPANHRSVQLQMRMHADAVLCYTYGRVVAWRPLKLDEGWEVLWERETKRRRPEVRRRRARLNVPYVCPCPLRMRSAWRLACPSIGRISWLRRAGAGAAFRSSPLKTRAEYARLVQILPSRGAQNKGRARVGWTCTGGQTGQVAREHQDVGAPLFHGPVEPRNLSLILEHFK